MCGIAGIVTADTRDVQASLARMVAVLHHRGPDAARMHLLAGCALGHTRLSIVDAAGSPQPMLSPDRQRGLVFNGEIYGYQAIRASLPDYPFQTAGDTEVLLALYERYGRALPAHLPGMFAFALWDDGQRALLCARDRFGEKPFFYATGRGGEFVFASEIKAILAGGLVDTTIDDGGLRHYLRRGYSHPARTIYRHVHALPPAHALVVQDGTLAIERYWQFPQPEQAISLDDAADRFRELFRQSVQRQLVADVPVGAFLSGGLDSSSIVAVAAEQHPAFKTFSFGFGESIDELPYARGIARRYHTDHIELSDGDADIASLLEQMPAVYDEPFGDSSCVPTFLISNLARRHVTVALSGEGADELTGGYNFWYRSLFNLERARRMPDVTATLIRLAAHANRALGRQLPRSLGELWEGFFMKQHYPRAIDAHYARTAVFSPAELATFGMGTGVPHGGSRMAADGLDEVLRADIEEYLAGDILVKTDRASMAHGLEVRCPFLDVDFASFCISLPTRLKIDAHTEKLVLRAAFAEAWTPEIRRRGKQGFGAPIADWLQRPDVRDLKHALFGNRRSRLFEYLPFQQVAPYVERNNTQTWLLLVLALWLEQEKRHAAAA